MWKSIYLFLTLMRRWINVMCARGQIQDDFWGGSIWSIYRTYYTYNRPKQIV